MPVTKTAAAPSPNLYETDFYAWTQEQADFLRRGRVSTIELMHIAEEIDTLGRKEISELRSRYTVLAQHLLKERFQPEKSTRSWSTTILVQRLAIRRHMDDNPSLNAKADTISPRPTPTRASSRPRKPGSR